MACFNLNFSLSPHINWYDIGPPEIACPWQPFVLQKFAADFRQGGWDAWITMIKPSGNVYGRYILESDPILITQSRTREEALYQAVAGQGFPGDATTPGILQANAVNKATMMDWDYLMSQQEFDQFLAAVGDAFISRIIKSGLTLIQTNTYDYTDNGASYQLPAQETTYIASQTDQEYVASLKGRLSLLQDGLKNLLNEQTQNLKIMQDIKTAQDKMASSSCVAATPYIGTELSQAQTETTLTQQKITATQQTILNNDALIRTITSLDSAKKSGNQAVIDASVNDYNAARKEDIASLNSLLGDNQTDMAAIYKSINDYIASATEKANQAIQTRGVASINSGLYNRLSREQQALAACPAATTAGTTTP
jgi:hypothetical protein